MKSPNSQPHLELSGTTETFTGADRVAADTLEGCAPHAWKSQHLLFCFTCCGSRALLVKQFFDSLSFLVVLMKLLRGAFPSSANGQDSPHARLFFYLCV